MAVDQFSLATRLAVLLAGRDPQWVQQAVAGSDAPPATSTSGVPLNDSPSTMVYAALREDVAHRTALLSIPTLTIGDTFTVTIDGTAVVYDSTGAVDLDEVIVAIAAALNANPTVAALVTASDVDANGVEGTGASIIVRIEGDTATDFSVDFTDSGTSVVAAVADAVEATGRLYWKMGAANGITAPVAWVARETFAVQSAGFVDRYPTGGIARAHLALTARMGAPSDGSIVTLRDPDIQIGPAVVES